MAGRKKQKSTAKLQSFLTTALSILIEIFISIGKPFYFIISHIFISILFVFFIIGKLFFKLLYFIKKINFHFPKIKYPSFKIKPLDIKINKKFTFSALIISLFSFLIYFLVFKDLPSPHELTTRQIDVSTKIYDRNDNLLYTIYKNKNRTPVRLIDVPNHLKMATIAAEDAEFYDHIGFSAKGTIRAIYKNISKGKLEGGSTITQQLVKNALLSSEKTYIRKIRELILSIGVEFTFTKDQILEMYLNEVSYGGTIYGIQEASLHYFGKDVNKLTLAESALIAGLPQSPTKYSPFGNHPDLTFSRQREVLHLMVVNKFITKQEEDVALAERITFYPNKQNIEAPHFVMFIREKLIEEYGEETVLKGGLTVKTTLDLNIQKMAEQIAQQEIKKLSNLNVTNAGVVVLNPVNNEILAMVGSVDYFDTEKGGNVNVTTRIRQPGSSIKIVNYAAGLSDGLTLASIIDDSPTSFNVIGQKPYTPKNYDGTYKGKITLRQAFAESRNIPAVKVLASIGVNKMIDLAENMGITTWKDRSRYGLSLTLGGGETKLLELAEVYSTVANYGNKQEIKSILEVKNYKNKSIYQTNRFSETSKKVLDPRVAYLLINVLKDNFARSPAFGSNSKLVIKNHPEVAVKTGTSNDLKDNLTIGFNKDYVVAVWVGNNNSSPMSRIASGITGAAPIWNGVMSSLLKDKPTIEWATPSGMIYKECYGRKEWFLEEKQLNCPKIIEPAAKTEN